MAYGLHILEMHYDCKQKSTNMMAWERLWNWVFFGVHVKYLDGQKSRLNFIYVRGNLPPILAGSESFPNSQVQ